MGLGEQREVAVQCKWLYWGKTQDWEALGLSLDKMEWCWMWPEIRTSVYCFGLFFFFFKQAFGVEFFSPSLWTPVKLGDIGQWLSVTFMCPHFPLIHSCVYDSCFSLCSFPFDLPVEHLFDFFFLHACWPSSNLYTYSILKTTALRIFTIIKFIFYVYFFFFFLSLYSLPYVLLPSFG